MQIRLNSTTKKRGFASFLNLIEIVVAQMGHDESIDLTIQISIVQCLLQAAAIIAAFHS